MSSCCSVEKHHSRHSHTMFIFTMLATSKSIVCCCEYKIWLTQNGGSIEATVYPVSWLLYQPLMIVFASNPRPCSRKSHSWANSRGKYPSGGTTPAPSNSLWCCQLVPHTFPLTPCCCHSPNTLPSSLEAKKVEILLLEVFHYFSGHTCQTFL